LKLLGKILDLCGGTGAWSRPYKEAGYDVVLVDLPTDIRLIGSEYLNNVHGVLAAPPCTVFSYARNRYPPTDTEYLEALSVVDACLRCVVLSDPIWWALENPRNKLRHFLGDPAFTFYQWEFGDPAIKSTCIWGEFNEPSKSPSPPTKPSTFKTSTQNASPKDGITPKGFAEAFFKANP